MTKKEEFKLQLIKHRKFSLFRNFLNSWNGLVEVSKNEKPMKAELILGFFLSIVILFLDNMALHFKIILFASLLLPILVELINSAIERVVDLVTTEYHTLAKHAKDAASAAVLVSLLITAFIWISVLYYVYY